VPIATLARRALEGQYGLVDQPTPKRPTPAGLAVLNQAREAATRQKLAEARAAHPEAGRNELARLTGVSPRIVSKHLQTRRR
jgi:hypothetical protein